MEIMSRKMKNTKMEKTKMNTKMKNTKILNRKMNTKIKDIKMKNTKCKTMNTIIIERKKRQNKENKLEYDQVKKD